MRTYLTSPASFNYAPTGNDITGDGSLASPWATPTRAYNWIRDNLDFGGQSIIVTGAHGTYPQFSASGHCTGQIRATDLRFTGDVANSWACVLAGVNGVYIGDDASLKIEGVSPQGSGSGTTGGFGITIESGNVQIGSMGWKNCPSGFVSASGNHSYVTISGGHAIVTGAVAALIAEAGSQIIANNVGFLTIGPLNFSLGFLIADELGLIDTRGSSFTQSGGSCTGPQGVATSNGVIITDTVVPGSGYIPETGGQILHR